MPKPKLYPEPKNKPRKRRRVAISLELDFGFKRHLEIYAGSQTYADEADWECVINPAIDGVENNRLVLGRPFGASPVLSAEKQFATAGELLVGFANLLYQMFSEANDISEVLEKIYQIVVNRKKEPVETDDIGC